MSFPVVEEGTVQIASTRYLAGRGALPYRFSVARGKGINTSEFIAQLSKPFQSSVFNPQFSSDGADIEALSETEWWRVECKGTGVGKGPTQRNNFDRALASVVTYFEEPPYSLGTNSESAKLFLGLALPESPDYLRELRRRVRAPLRKCLNLWVLLYQPSTNSVKAISPTESF